MRLKDLYKKRLGIALSSGAARGFAHLGVLEILTQAGIRPYCIAGSSAGAVMGAIYCGGKMPEYIQRIQDWTRRDTLVCMDPVVPRSGLINGHKILEFNS